MHKVLLQCSDVKAFMQKKEVKDKRKTFRRLYKGIRKFNIYSKTTCQFFVTNA